MDNLEGMSTEPMQAEVKKAHLGSGKSKSF